MILVMMIFVYMFFEAIFGCKLLVTNLEVLNKRDLLNRLYVLKYLLCNINSFYV